MTENLLGLLRVKVVKGVNLAIRDVWSSDPYVILKLGKQRLKTRVIRNNINPEWNEELTLSINDANLPIRLKVYDKDRFSMDDPMGNAEFEIQEFVEAQRMKLEGITNGTIIRKVTPNRSNCLSEESLIYWSDGKIIQDLVLRLRNVECGEVELQLQWFDLLDSCNGL